MPSDLTKSEKKIARQIIEKGLMREYQNAIENLEGLITDWRQGKRDKRETYMELYQALKDHDKHIARRYNRISGSNYLLVIAGQLADKVVTVKDLEGLKKETIHTLMVMIGNFD
jgi:hypothetical protein